MSYYTHMGREVLPTYVGVIPLDGECIANALRTTHIRGGDPTTITTRN